SRLCKERFSEQRREKNYEFAVRNRIAWKSKSQDQKISPVYTQQAIWKQIMRPMLNQNQNQAFEQNQEIQITRTHNDMLPPNSVPRGQPPTGQGPTGPHALRNAAIPQSTIFPPALNAEQKNPRNSKYDDKRNYQGSHAQMDVKRIRSNTSRQG
ncbi:MAG: hypothetical protein EZS28_035687, partial [Streblomastix strix]